MAVWIGSVPYEPMDWDLADATTNVIWTDLYSQGIYEVPLDEWDHGMTQSVVVEHDGEFVVVNEKGPGFVWMLVPFHVAGCEFLFGPLMAGIAVFSTYILGMRLFGWRVGFIAAVIVLVNLSVIVMWHRYYWTDAATMHLLVLSLWLFVEANYRFNGGSLDPRDSKKVSRNGVITAFICSFLSGLAFAASISTRYPVALVILAPMTFILLFYLYRAWPMLRKGRIAEALRNGKGIALLLFFFLGLMCILVPLMQYNSEYFGGPLKSGYDANTLMEFNASAGAVPRNQSGNWFENIGERVITTLENTVALIPILILRMPALLLAPLGIWLLRKRRFILMFLVQWIFIAFYTYLSLSFVDRYADPRMYFDVVWEPRYFMPAIPAVALLGALGMDHLSFHLVPRLLNRAENKKTVSVHQPTDCRDIDRRLVGTIISLMLLALIALPGIVPAADNFRDPGMIRPHHPKPPGPIRVTTDGLLMEPDEFVQRFVLVDEAQIVEVLPGGWRIRSIGSSNPGNVTVRLADWPLDEIPGFDAGDEVIVHGLFLKVEPPERPAQYFINVKWGTKDYIRLARP